MATSSIFPTNALVVPSRLGRRAGIFGARIALFIPISVAILGCPAWADTAVGDKLEMQCGEHKVVLTCGHSEEITTRQRTYPRLCNDNTLRFIANDGVSKILNTNRKGKHRDKTPVEAICEEFVPLSKRYVQVWMNDTAWSFSILLDENGIELQPIERPKYRVDYTKSITVSRIAIKEPQPWQRKQ